MGYVHPDHYKVREAPASAHPSCASAQVGELTLLLYKESKFFDYWFRLDHRTVILSHHHHHTFPCNLYLNTVRDYCADTVRFFRNLWSPNLV